MDAKKVESLLTGAGVSFERTGDKIWELKPGSKRNLTANMVCVLDEFRDGGDLLKIHTVIGSLPEKADVEYFQGVFRKNRDLGHGGFSLKFDDTVCLVDTLELDNCDQNEMDATLDWIEKAKEIFNEPFDPEKMPYLDGSRFSK